MNENIKKPEVHIVHFSLEKPIEILALPRSNDNTALHHVCKNVNRFPASFLSAEPDSTLTIDYQRLYFQKFTFRYDIHSSPNAWKPEVNAMIAFCQECKTLFISTEDVVLKNGNRTRRR